MPSATLIAELAPPHAVNRTRGLDDPSSLSKADFLVPSETGFVYPGVNVPSAAWLDSRQGDVTFRVENSTVTA
jgi:hypothetical protein